MSRAPTCCGAPCYLEGELDALLDESWIEEGVERLSTVPTIAQTVEPLSAAGVTVHAQIAALESCWYMRNQLLRDTDWSSMAHGLEVRVPFVDATLLERIGPAIASAAPPSKRDLAGCARAPSGGGAQSRKDRFYDTGAAVDIWSSRPCSSARFTRLGGGRASLVSTVSQVKPVSRSCCSLTSCRASLC